MFEKVNVPVLGVIENMSYFLAPSGERIPIFSSGGGEKLARELGVPLLGQIPLQAGMTDLADQGTPIVVGEPESAAAKAFQEIVQEVRRKVGGKSIQLPIV
jgi:ATP-binding protein involved in chromosome partitioning